MFSKNNKKFKQSQFSTIKVSRSTYLLAYMTQQCTQTQQFNDVDRAMGNNGKEETINAPKNIERLEEISTLRNIQRKMEEEHFKEV